MLKHGGNSIAAGLCCRWLGNFWILQDPCHSSLNFVAALFRGKLSAFCTSHRTTPNAPNALLTRHFGPRCRGVIGVVQQSPDVLRKTTRFPSQAPPEATSGAAPSLSMPGRMHANICEHVPSKAQVRTSCRGRAAIASAKAVCHSRLPGTPQSCRLHGTQRESSDRFHALTVCKLQTLQCARQDDLQSAKVNSWRQTSLAAGLHVFKHRCSKRLARLGPAQCCAFIDT